MTEQNNLPAQIKLPGGRFLSVRNHKQGMQDADGFFKKNNLEYITSAELAKVRIQTGKKSVASSYGTFTGECYVSLLNGDLMIVSKKFNPILKNIEDACSHNNGMSEYYIRSDYGFSLRNHSEKNPEKAIKSGVLYVPKQDIPRYIPTKHFKINIITRFLYEDLAEEYGRFLADCGIPSINHNVANFDYIISRDPKTKLRTHKSPFCRQLWTHDLSRKSDLVAFPDITEGTIMMGVYHCSSITQSPKEIEDVTSSTLEVPDSEEYLGDEPKIRDDWKD